MQQETSSLIVALEGLDIICIVGTEPHERLKEQAIEIDLEFAPESIDCAKSDQLAHAIDYTEVVKRCHDVAHRGKYHLLEALAYATATAVLEQFPLLWVRLSVRKGRPLPHLAASRVEVLLHRHDIRG